MKGLLKGGWVLGVYGRVARIVWRRWEYYLENISLTLAQIMHQIIRDPIDDADEVEDSTPTPEDGDLLDEDEEGQELYQGAPATLLAELQLRKQQAKLRTRPITTVYPNGVRSTLLQLDAVAQVEQQSRKQKRVHLAWEDPADQGLEDETGEDEDVPLAMLYAKKSQVQDPDTATGFDGTPRHGRQ